jgi:hypothetical protein
LILSTSPFFIIPEVAVTVPPDPLAAAPPVLTLERSVFAISLILLLTNPKLSAQSLN